MRTHTMLAAWLDCTACGKTTKPTRPAPSPASTPERWAYCACGHAGPVREVEVRWTPGKQTPCNSACLNGRVSCDCRCGGRCHGKGYCLCRSEKPWTPPGRPDPKDQGKLF